VTQHKYPKHERKKLRAKETGMQEHSSRVDVIEAPVELLPGLVVSLGSRGEPQK
jgi:hypothetical protein